MSLNEDFKDALSAWATGVSVVTVRQGEMLYGLTVSSFTSVSLDPPLILVCISRENRLHEMVSEAGRFGVSILSSEQQRASQYFATPGREPTPHFVEIEGEWTHSGVPVVKHALAFLVCALEQQIALGDHEVLVGRVVEAHSAPGGAPLLYYDRGYRSLRVD